MKVMATQAGFQCACAIAVGLAGAALARPANAQTFGSFDRMFTSFSDALKNTLDLQPSDVTNLRLGVGPGFNPDFEGARTYSVHPVPVISLHYRDVLTVDNNHVDFTAFNQVLDLGDEDENKNINFGPQVNFDFGRPESISPALRGLGGVGISVELGGYINYTSSKVKVELSITQDVAGGHGGAIADLTTTAPLYHGERLIIGGQFIFTTATSKYLKSFFGVTPYQSSQSGLPVFHPSGGPKDVLGGLTASYILSRHWSLLGNIAYERLLGDAAASPLVVQRGSPNQAIASGFIVYAF